ncbi:MAG: PKD domain-containing protein [Chitinophagaceae bacterium]|nr:PKD domain-containing protein [Chitinophagaceae bacterium]
MTTASNANNLLSTYPDNNTVWVNWPNTTDTYQLTINLNNKHLCCTSTASITINPKVKFSVSGPSTICAGQSGSFSTNPAGTFNWAANPILGVSPPTATSAASYTASFANTGTYVITATDVSGSFCNNTATTTTTVIPVPVPGTIQGPLVGCVGGQYAYNMSTAAPSGYYYEWTITNGTFQPGSLTTTTGDNVNVQWTSLSGTITVNLRQSASPFCNIPAGNITVTAATPGAITGTPNVCVDGTGTYSLSGGNLPSGTTVTWSISPASLGTIISGQGTTGPITIVWHGQGGPGPWGPATVSATTGCGNPTPFGGIMVSPKFTFSIIKTGLDICQPGGVTLTATGAPGGTTFNWVPGGPGQTITVSTPGSYTCTGTKGGCSFSQTYTVPDPFAIIPGTCGVGFCNGLATNEQLSVQVIKPGSGTFTYEWRSGTCASPGGILQTTTSASLSNSFTAPADGNYCVIVKYGNCTRCLDFVVKKVCCPNVNNPVITNTTQVTCDTYTFTGTTPNPTGATITWNFGDGITAPGASGVPITHTYSNAGVYCVTFCVGPPSPNPTNCTGNCAVTQAVVPIAANFSYKLGCNGCLDVTNLSAIFGNPAFVTYLWNFGDATTSTLQNPPQHCYANGGTYTVTLTVTYNDGVISCTKTATQTVVYTPLSIAISGPVCSDQPVTFSSSPGGFVTYAWNFGDGFTAYTSPIVHIYSAAGIYNVTLSVTDLLGNTCTASRPDTVLAGISNCTILPAYLCPGTPATLTAPAGPYTYQWEVQNNMNVFVPAPGVNNTATYTTLVPGFYHVIITNANGCTCTSNTVEVKAVPKPKSTFSVSPSKNLCAPGGMITLTGPMISGYTYSWIANGNYGSPIGSSPIFMTFVTSTTVYSLILTNQYGCKDTCTQTITVNTPPAPPILTGSGSCEGVPITISVTNYASNITWNTGASTTSITVYQAGTYVATYTDPVTGCTSTGKYVVNRRPSAGLFPHYCDSIPCNCIRPFVLYAPNPLIGVFASNYSINWYNGNTNALLGSGNSYNNGGLGVQTGSYYIIITDQLTGCKDTSNKYSIVVPKCDTCDCKGSMWGPITATPGEQGPIKDDNAKANVVIGGNPIKLNCGIPAKMDCNKPYTINASYLCADTACNGKVTFSLQPPTGLPITGTLPYTFTPNQTGTYILTLYGWCGNKICDSCVIDIIVDCKKCECKGSKWGEKTYTIDGATKSFNCQKPGDKPIEVKCKTTVSVNANYNCADPTCNGAVTYMLVQPSGTTTGNAPVSFILNLTGIYTLTLYGWCGTTICDSCVISFKTNCDTVPGACCPYNITVKDPTIQLSTISNPDATVANANFAITGPPGNLFTEIRAEVMSYNLFSNFNNECLSCKSYPYTWASIYQAGTVGAIPPKITMYNSTAPSFNPAGNGMYQNPREVVWTGNPPFALPNNLNIQFLLPPASIIDCCELTARICVKFTFRDKDCKECEVITCFTVVIKPKGGGHDDPEVCECKIDPVLSYEGNPAKKVNCGETVNLFLGNIPVNLNPNFTCKNQNGKDCAGSSLTVMITRPDNSSQILSGPNYSYTFLSMTGLYEYTITGNCGGKKCECKFKVNIPK